MTRTLSYGQRQFMINHIADGLRTLGLDVTPPHVERELQHMDTLLRSASAQDYVPPDPYAAGIAKMRENNQ